VQADSEQRRHKLSFHLTASPERSPEDVMGALRKGLQEAGVAAKVIYSGGVDVDIISERAGKGCALKFLLQQLRKANAYPTLGVQASAARRSVATFRRMSLRHQH
jgi:sucrose-6-phosphatase